MAGQHTQETYNVNVESVRHAALNPSMTKTWEALRELRARAGLSMNDLASEAGFAGSSSYQRYESATGYKMRRYLTPEIAARLAKVLAGLGSPPISRDEVMMLAGIAPGPSAPPGMVILPEFDVRAESGGVPSMFEILAQDAGEHVVGHYGFPKDSFRHVFGAPPDGVTIIEVVGDSMSPTLQPGQKVMVNLSDKRPSPPGIFVVWDGLGLVLKRVEFVPHSSPATVRIISDNREYQAYERSLDEAHVVGRVIVKLDRT